MSVSRLSFYIFSRLQKHLVNFNQNRYRASWDKRNTCQRTTLLSKCECIHKFSMPFKSICVKVEKVYKFRRERDTCISCTYQNYRTRSNLRSWTWPRRGRAPRMPAFHTLHSQGSNRHTTELHQNKRMVINTMTSYRNQQYSQ